MSFVCVKKVDSKTTIKCLLWDVKLGLITSVVGLFTSQKAASSGNQNVCLHGIIFQTNRSSLVSGKELRYVVSVHSDRGENEPQMKSFYLITFGNP